MLDNSDFIPIFLFPNVGGLNFSSFSRMMKFYKFHMDELEGIPTVVNQSFKFVFQVMAVFLVVFLIFSNTRTLVGRTNTLDSLSYISSYFGDSLQCFDVYLLRN